MTPERRENPMRVLRPQQTLRELALEKMRQSILDRYFKPGDRLVERDLCDQLGVSRTVVREVLRHLESEGLVSILANRGPIVAETSMDEARQIYEIRAALEGMAAGECAARADPATLLRLEEALKRIRAAYAASDMRGVLTETTEFYRALFEGAGNAIALGIVTSLTVRINHLRSLTINTERRNVEGPRQMDLVIAAIRKGDRASAAAAAATHVANASRIALALLADEEPR